MKSARFRRSCILGLVFVVVLTGSAVGDDIDMDGVIDTADECPNTPPGLIVDDGGRPLGDHDGDCDVDLADMELIIANFTGPMTPIDHEACDDAIDNDGDTLIDCEDASDCPVGTVCGGDILFCSQYATCGCPDGSGDCDGNPANGCETDVDSDLQHCGQCESVCTVANGDPTCKGGECFVDACHSGWCDVDLLYANGCEFPLNANPACSAVPYSATIPGDDFSDPVVLTGRGEKWFRIRLTEDDDFDVYLSARIILESATDTDYDLYLYCSNCSAVPVASSTHGTGVLDTAFIRNNDDWGSLDDFDVLIEVRWKSGACGDYTLTVHGDFATSSNNCDS